MRLQAEKDIGRRLNHALDTHPGVGGVVPAPGPVGPVPPAGPSFFHQLRYALFYGFTKYNSDFYDFNSKYRWGVTAEGNLNPNTALGIYFNYASIDDLTIDYSGYGPWIAYGPTYPQFEQTMWSFGIFGKYYFQNWNAVRPYLYGGLGYNRITTKYSFADTNPYWRNTVYTQEEYSSSSFSGQIAGGLLLDFSPNFGMFVQLGAVFSFGSDQANYYNGEAASRGKALEDATGADITIGASFKF
jgi:opacity protein-like surface antigen